MSSMQIYTVACRRCGTERRVPGWDEVAELAHRHAEHGGSVNIRRVWLRAGTPAPAVA